MKIRPRCSRRRCGRRQFVRGCFACGRVSFWTPRKKPKRRSGAAAGSDSSAFAPSSSTAAPLRTPGDAAGAAPGHPGLASGPPETTPRSPLMLAALPSLGTAFQPPPTGGLPRRGLVPAAGDGWASTSSAPEGKTFGRGKPLPYGKAEESTVYHRAGQLMGTRRLFPWGPLHPPAGTWGGSIGGRECVMGPQPEPSVSGSGWERPIPPVRGKWPKAKGGRDEQGSGRSFRRPGGNGAKRTLRGRGAPVRSDTRSVRPPP